MVNLWIINYFFNTFKVSHDFLQSKNYLGLQNYFDAVNFDLVLYLKGFKLF